MTPVAGVGLALLLCTACKTSAQNQDATVVQTSDEPFETTDLDKFAQRLEDLSVAGDVEGLSALWSDADDFDGCSVSKPTQLPPGEFVAEQLLAFRKAARGQMGKKQRGTAIFTNRRELETVSFQTGVLEGEDCGVTARSRVNVVVEPTSKKPMVIEHRYNAVLTANGWRLYRYLPNRPNCKKAAGRKHVGCQKLVELRPELVGE